MVNTKIVGYKEILNILDYYDGRCYQHFKAVLEAKDYIRKGLEPLSGYTRALNGISAIEGASTNLKNYIGFLKAKAMILRAHKQFLDKRKGRKKIIVN